MIKFNKGIKDAMGNPIPAGAVAYVSETIGGTIAKTEVKIGVEIFRESTSKENGDMALLLKEYLGNVNTEAGVRRGFRPFESVTVTSLSEIDTNEKIEAIAKPLIAVRFGLEGADLSMI